MLRNRPTFFIIAVSLLIAVVLTAAVWDIHFWPTDAEDYYIEIAGNLTLFRPLSDMHRSIDAERVRLAHGKEIFFLCVSVFQRLLDDFTTLRPIVLLCIVSIFLASIFIYLILRGFWGTAAGVVCWFLFVSSAWPYMYILMAKHQPVGLMFFLLAVFLITKSSGTLKGRAILFVSGLSLGCSLFSSTVSGLYLPYHAAAFAWILYRDNCGHGRGFRFRENLISCAMVLAGLLAVLLYINLPDIAANIKGYWEYIQISSGHNHFFYNQPFLQQWFPFAPAGHVRGGWMWVFRYFTVMMPLLFPVYLLGLVYLLAQTLVRRDIRFFLKVLAVFALSAVSTVMAEIVRAAQYGANYFPALIGVIFLTGFCFHDWLLNGWVRRRVHPVSRTWLLVLFAAVLGLQAGVNAVMFCGDIYPMRMSKTFLSRYLQQNNIHRLYTYAVHPQLKAFAPYLTQTVLKELTFVPIRTIAQARDGYVLVPPITGDSIYIAATSPYIHFDQDLFLNALVARRRLKEYAVVSFPTLAGSRYWIHEEEILTYRDLILGQHFEENDLLGRVWILDAARFQRDIDKNMPLPDDLDLMRQNRRRIGTANNFLIYRGYVNRLDQPMPLQRLTADIRTAGAPEDTLVAYVYRLEDKQPVWVPAAEKFFSVPLMARDVPHTGDQPAVFHFQPPIDLPGGLIFIVIYRTGPRDDQNYYTIAARQLSLE